MHLAESLAEMLCGNMEVGSGHETEGTESRRNDSRQLYLYGTNLHYFQPLVFRYVERT